jgi:hypothetical protein
MAESAAQASGVVPLPRIRERPVTRPDPWQRPETGRDPACIDATHSSATIARFAEIAFSAGQCPTDDGIAPLGRLRPWSIRPGRVVPDMLEVAARELGHPVAAVVEMKAGHGLIHEAHSFGRTLLRQRSNPIA